MKQLARTIQKIENMQTQLARAIQAKRSQREQDSEEEKKKLVDMISRLRSDLRNGREELEQPSRVAHERRVAESVPDERDDRDGRDDRDENPRRPQSSDRRREQRPTRPSLPRGRGRDAAERPRQKARGKQWRRSNPDRCKVVSNFAFLKTVSDNLC